MTERRKSCATVYLFAYIMSMSHQGGSHDVIECQFRSFDVNAIGYITLCSECCEPGDPEIEWL
jgi:hypothetical protein